MFDARETAWALTQTHILHCLMARHDQSETMRARQFQPTGGGDGRFREAKHRPEHPTATELPLAAKAAPRKREMRGCPIPASEKHARSWQGCAKMAWSSVLHHGLAPHLSTSRQTACGGSLGGCIVNGGVVRCRTTRSASASALEASQHAYRPESGQHHAGCFLQNCSNANDCRVPAPSAGTADETKG